ncbi:hypothetical protein [Ferrimonas pelagia]|uniref:Uncharacterized protein n=1 Tax=Ferrimonas pelagia TaxID=1177826 RepID=A0ABP9F3Y7_9GAMM
MGNITGIIDGIDNQDETADEVIKQLTMLRAYAVEKAKNATTQIEESIRLSGDDERKRVPVDVIIRSKSEEHVFHSESSNIGTAVRKSISNFMGIADDGDTFVNGISGLVDGALDTMLGAGHGMSSEMRDYFIVPTEYGMTRYDTYLYTYGVNTSALTQVCQSVVVGVMFESIVDLSKISFPTFMQIYKLQLVKMGVSVQDQKPLLDLAENTFLRIVPKEKIRPSAESVISILPASKFVK